MTTTTEEAKRVSESYVIQAPRLDCIKVVWMRDGTVWELKGVHGAPLYEGGPPSYRRSWYAVLDGTHPE